jgi:hypothetical protein
MTTERQVVAVTVEPCLVDGIPRRLVEFADGSGAVQSWRGSEWMPGGCSVKDVLMATPCADPAAGAAR